MDAEIAKMTQKLLTKQGMKFKLNTKVMSGDDLKAASRQHGSVYFERSPLDRCSGEGFH